LERYRAMKQEAPQMQPNSKRVHGQESGEHVKFSGFGEYAIDFYDGLELDNSKAYWDDHKETYLRDVKAPMEALLAALAPEFGEGKVFRPYRDVRFSKDKTPYKTHCGGVIEKGRGGGAYYAQISSEGLVTSWLVTALRSTPTACCCARSSTSCSSRAGRCTAT
jgi:uncharacterized protein (DUF2461 family)